ncbi:uncharacterized protein Dana_GF19694 [Drosophila ananassae]|uniref:Peptidase S1 domain-containing protein n=1 Tax=Drosophila ananassae TaxID=7217 RepID=B3ML10_DROAN|nr:uncharacterized protein Dana_GF19694 [Drosophila ananassae]
MITATTWLLLLSSAFGHLSRVSKCGSNNRSGVDFLGSYRGKETSPGQYPWVLAALDCRDSLTRYIGGGSLIASSVVLSSVQVLRDTSEADLLVRAGEWNVSTTTEMYSHVDRPVKRIVRHEQFNNQNGDNDVALLFLTLAFPAQPNIRPVCLAEEPAAFGGVGCFYNGWGMEETNSLEYPNVLKKVTIIVKSNVSSISLSDNFILGQATNRNIGCKGESGSPLVCPVPRNPNSFEQIGILICKDGRPSLFTNVAKFLPWINKQVEDIAQNDDYETNSKNILVY